MKLTTTLIKKHLNNTILKTDWKRITKRKFEYNNVKINNDDGTVTTLDGKLNWRVYQSDESEPVFVIDDGTTILCSTDERELLPTSCFRYGLRDVNPQEPLFIFLLFEEKFSEIVGSSDVFDEIGPYEDNIREYTVAGFEEACQDANLILSNDQENTFSFYVRTSSGSLEPLKNTTNNKKQLRDFLRKIGIKHSFEIDQMINR